MYKEKEAFNRFRATHTHQLTEINRLAEAGQHSKVQLLEDYIVTEYIRTTHSARAREIIATCWNEKVYYQDTDLTEVLASLCFSHNENYTYLLNMESFKVCGQDTYLCLPFVATMLRIADIIDFDPKRTPPVLFSHLTVKNGIPVDRVDILEKDIEIDGEIFTLSSNIEYGTNCIKDKSTNISVDENGSIESNTAYSERLHSKSSLSIHGIDVPCKLFSDYDNRQSKTIIKLPFPFSFRLDIGQNSDLNLNSARSQIIYDEKWISFEENLYRVICNQLMTILKPSDWTQLKTVILSSNAKTFKRIVQMG